MTFLKRVFGVVKKILLDKVLTYQRDNFFKYFRFVFREVGKNLSVQFYVFLSQASDKRAVFCAGGAAGGVDFHIPKSAKIALFFFAAAKGVRPGMYQRFFGSAFFRFSAPTKSFGIAEDFLAFFMFYNTSFYSCH